MKELSIELQECKRLKAECDKYFIKRLRIQLIEQWDKMHKSQKDREKFEFLHSDMYTEYLLQLHEMELKDCTRFYDENK